MSASALSLTIPTPLPERELQAQIQQALETKFTGELHVSFLNGWSETIFAHEGQTRQIYIRNHRVPDLKWTSPLVRFGRGNLAVRPMPARAMMFRKIILEESAPIQLQHSGTNQLKTMFSLAQQNNHPTLFHIQWNRAEGFVLIAGKAIPIRQAVLLAKAEAEEGHSALDQVSAWDEPQCKVSVYRGNIRKQAWLDVHLNILFEWYCQSILNQYGQLTGKVVVRSVMQNVLGLAGRNKLTISICENQLCDATILPTPGRVGDAYREAMTFIKNQMEPIIGSALTGNLFKQAKEMPRDVYRTVEEAFGLIEEAE